MKSLFNVFKHYLMLYYLHKDNTQHLDLSIILSWPTRYGITQLIKKNFRSFLLSLRPTNFYTIFHSPMVQFFPSQVVLSRPMTQQISYKFFFLNFYLLLSVFHNDKLRSSFDCHLIHPRASSCVLHLGRELRSNTPYLRSSSWPHTSPGAQLTLHHFGSWRVVKVTPSERSI